MSITGTAIATIVVDEIAAAEDFATRISASWQKSVEAIFETGRLIAQAKDALPHGDFTAMIEGQLPFGARTAQMLMKVATDQRLTNPKHASHLPPSWATLYELTKLDDDTLTRRIKEGTIRPDMQRRDVSVQGERSLMAGREQAAGLDFFPTPPWATRSLVEVILPHLGVSIDGLTVYDPGCGEGHITGALEEYPANVIGTDIKDYASDGRAAPAWAGELDYLDRSSAAPQADWVIMNAPFSDEELGDRPLHFTQRALDEAKVGVASFVRTTWLDGIGRYENLFSVRPPTLYAQFAERVNLCKDRWEPMGSTATAYCWLVWVKDRTPQPVFWVPPGQRKRFFADDDIERFTAHPVLPPKSQRARPDIGVTITPSDVSGPTRDALISAERLAADQMGDGSFAPPSHPADASPAPPPESHTTSTPEIDTSPFRSTPETDAIIRAGYEAEPFDLDALATSLGATKLQVRRRANQLGLGSRDRQREAVARANAARGGAA